MAADYLERHKATILQNVQIQPDRTQGLDKDEYWHIFTRESHLEDEARKVCVPMTSKEPVATCLNREKVYCDNANMFYLRFNDETEDRMYALAAIINSTPFSTMARMYANPQQGGYYKFSRQFLNPVPFPCEAFRTNSTEIVELAQIGKEIENIKTSMYGMTSQRRETLSALVEHEFERIDEICCNLYGVDGADLELLMSHRREDRTE